MSHFPVVIALDEKLTDRSEIEKAIESVLDPYDERKHVQRYVYQTREQLIESERKSNTYLAERLAEFDADPAAYRKEYPHNERHLEFLADEGPEGARAKLSWNDEQLYAEAIRYTEPENIGPNGEEYSEGNPRAKWDWWVVGGRWGGFFTLKDGVEPDPAAVSTEESVFGMADKARAANRTDCERVKNLAAEAIPVPFAYIGFDGEWVEKGQMGWFAMVANETDQDVWEQKYRQWLTTLPGDTWLVMVDCHI